MALSDKVNVIGEACLYQLVLLTGIVCGSSSLARETRYLGWNRPAMLSCYRADAAATYKTTPISKLALAERGDVDPSCDRVCWNLFVLCNDDWHYSMQKVQSSSSGGAGKSRDDSQLGVKIPLDSLSASRSFFQPVRQALERMKKLDDIASRAY